MFGTDKINTFQIFLHKRSLDKFKLNQSFRKHSITTDFIYQIDSRKSLRKFLTFKLKSLLT